MIVLVARLATVLNDVRLSASPCRGVSTKVFISPKKPELIARAFLWALVLRGVVVIPPSLLAYLLAALIGWLARGPVFLIMVFTLRMAAALLR
jgi:hypothetical protein